MAGRNPPWARDELILALDLYLRHRPHIPDPADPEIVQLSELLNQLPIHTVRPDTERFRNPNGVAMKLANFQALDPSYPGAGLADGGRGDRETWDRYYQSPDELHVLANALRLAAANRTAPATPEEDEAEAEEGRIAFRLHRNRERNSNLGRKKKQDVLRRTGRLACEVCGFDFAITYGSLGTGFIEAHHVVPLSESTGPIKVKTSDLALVCSNCHRMLHQARPWLYPDQLRQYLNTT